MRDTSTSSARHSAQAAKCRSISARAAGGTEASTYIAISCSSRCRSNDVSLTEAPRQSVAFSVDWVQRTEPSVFAPLLSRLRVLNTPSRECASQDVQHRSEPAVDMKDRRQLQRCRHLAHGPLVLEAQ